MLEKPILTGPRLTLRPITGDDAAAMHASLGDEEGMRLTGTQRNYTLEQVRAHCLRVAAADDRADYAITASGSPDYLGEAVLNDIDWENGSANYRIALARSELYGRGYGTEATRLLLGYAFGPLELYRVDLEVFDFNPRAQRVYEKVGFVREGVRRGALLWRGRRHDAVIMGILRDEFAP